MAKAFEVLPDRFDPKVFYAVVEDPGTWRDEDRNTPHEDEEPLDQMTRVWGKACYDALEGALPALLPLLDDPDDELALGFIMLLKIFPNSAALIVPTLQRIDPQKVSDARRKAVRDALAVFPS